MNDRFKFRVWRTSANEYADNHYSCAILRDGTPTTSEKGIIIEQCTGLRDKNGKLIYEGDIVTYTDVSGSGRPRHFQARAVRWCRDNCNFNVSRPPSDAETTIIGNIHETPELLK